MIVDKISDIYIEQLNGYNAAELCSIDGVKHPVILRKNTLDKFIADEIFNHKCYDISMKNSRMYQDYAEEYDVRLPQNIIDAGGNIGLASIFYANLYPKAQIVSVEPEEDNFCLLYENTKYYPNIKIVNGAVWDKNTDLVISNREEVIWDDGTKNAGKFRVGKEEITGERKVPAFTIDHIIKKYNMDMVDILKMDVEGAEREIFNGDFEKWLPDIRILLLEHHDFYKYGATKAVFKAISNYNFTYMHDNSDDLGTMMFLFDH